VHLFDVIIFYISLYNFGQTLKWFDSLRFLEWLIIWNGGSKWLWRNWDARGILWPRSWSFHAYISRVQRSSSKCKPALPYAQQFGSRQHNKTKLAVTNQSRMRMLSSTHASPSRSFNSIACVPKAFGYTMERVLILLCTVLHCCPSLAHNNTLFYICVCQSWSLRKCKDGVSQTQIGRSPSFTSIKNINVATFSGPVQ